MLYITYRIFSCNNRRRRRHRRRFLYLRKILLLHCIHLLTSLMINLWRLSTMLMYLGEALRSQYTFIAKMSVSLRREHKSWIFQLFSYGSCKSMSNYLYIKLIYISSILISKLIFDFRYMSGVSNKLGRSDDYGFVDPQLIHESNDFEQINMNLIRSFASRKKIYLLPYISG